MRSHAFATKIEEFLFLVGIKLQGEKCNLIFIFLGVYLPFFWYLYSKLENKP